MPRQSLTPVELARGAHIGAALRTARGDLSPLATATAAGISSETLRKIESGRVATPAFATIAVIAGVLGVSLDELWAETITAIPDAAPAPEQAQDESVE